MQEFHDMLSINITLLVIVAGMVTAGVYLVLEKNLTRVLLGVILLTNAINLLIITIGGKAGKNPIVKKGITPDEYNDPLPQVLILTAIVISFAVTAFLLGIIYRSWVLARQDDIEDDTEDQMIATQDIYDVEDDSYIPDEESEFSYRDITEAIADGALSSDESTNRKDINLKPLRGLSLSGRDGHRVRNSGQTSIKELQSQNDQAIDSQSTPDESHAVADTDNSQHEKGEK